MTANTQHDQSTTDKLASSDPRVRELTRAESRELGRTAYWDPAHKGQSVEKAWNRLNKGNRPGTSHIWKSEFINGWYGATMDDGPIPIPDDAGGNSARDAAQSEEFRQAALDTDPDRTLTLIDLIEYGRDSIPLPDDESLSRDEERSDP